MENILLKTNKKTFSILALEDFDPIIIFAMIQFVL